MSSRAIHLRFAVVSFASLLLTVPGIARSGASIVGPVEPRGNSRIGLEWTISAGSDQPGGDNGGALATASQMGLAFTVLDGRSMGVGLGIGYVQTRSPQTGAVLDDFFSALSGSSIQGTRFSIRALDVQLQTRVTPLPEQVPFVHVLGGFGIRRWRSHLSLPVDQLEAAGFTVLPAGSDPKATYEPIATAGVGLDVFRTGRLALGLDATHHWWFTDDSPSLQWNRFGGYIRLRQR